MKGKIAEIFESIQGEGIYLGKKQVFVRFYGCNLACKFCDTKPETFTEYSPRELFDKIADFPYDYHSIAFTGGEPLLQKAFLKEVLQLTKKAGLLNYLETNGALPKELEEVIDLVDIIAMDLKLPSSTQIGELWDKHRRFLKIALRKEIFLKAVICHSTEEEDIEKLLDVIKKSKRRLALVLQPNSYEHDTKLQQKMERFRQMCIDADVVAWIIPQVHKIRGIK
ncbi:MAG: 7-carboxy-7-deazaguanine synthase QueE [Candidatus Omnitrophica bacterium]|nr:7-carboxy-7-deazaguanine synthase QueE [Candidatus Omnitrophota bacterium]